MPDPPVENCRSRGDDRRLPSTRQGKPWAAMLWRARDARAGGPAVQDLPRSEWPRPDRAGRHRSHDRPRGVRGYPGALRLRQIDAARDHCGPSGRDIGPGPLRRRAPAGAAPDGHRLSGVCALPVADRPGQRGVRPRGTWAPARGTPRTSSAFHRHDRSRGLRGQVSPSAVWRHAPARWHCPRPGGGPGRAAHGRALLGPRRPDAHAHDGGAPGDLGARADEHSLRDSQHPGSRLHGRSRDRAVAAARARARHGAGRAQAAAARRSDGRDGFPAGLRAHLGPDQVPGAGRAGRGEELMAVERVAARDRSAFVRRADHRPLRLAALVSLLVLWEGFTRVGWIPSLFLPSPLGVLRELGEMAVSGQLMLHLAASLRRLLLGFALGAGAGVAVGIATGVFSRAEAVGQPLIAATFPIPKIALLPLLILWLGLGEPSKVAVIALGVFFPMAINTYAGVREADPLLVRAAVAFEIGRAHV